jgi:hypothetical protein
MANKARNFRIPLLSLTLLATLFAASSLRAGFSDDEFDEGSSPDQHDEIVWPQIEFPDAAARGEAFRPGQSFTFRAQWGIFRKAGRIEISTEAAPKSETPGLLVNMETASAGMIRKFYPMTLEATTLLDAQNWRVLRDEVDVKIRSDINRTLAHFDYEDNTINYIDHVEPERNKIRQLPYDITLDYASSILQLRSWDMSVGSRYPMCVNSRGKLYFVELEVMEKETIKTEFGDRACYRIEPVRVVPQSKTFREGGKMSIWMTADAERIPVRLDIKTSVGTARMLLEDYELPNATAVAKK